MVGLRFTRPVRRLRPLRRFRLCWVKINVRIRRLLMGKISFYFREHISSDFYWVVLRSSLSPENLACRSGGGKVLIGLHRLQRFDFWWARRKMPSKYQHDHLRGHPVGYIHVCFWIEKVENYVSFLVICYRYWFSNKKLMITHHWVALVSRTLYIKICSAKTNVSYLRMYSTIKSIQTH